MRYTLHASAIDVDLTGYDITIMEIILPDALATQLLGISLGKFLPEGTILLLEGDLGSGKTTLVQGIAQGLGIQETVESPTFTLINEYEEGRIPLYHLDLYRLTPEEIPSLNLEMYWEGRDFPLGIVAVEWSERLIYLPENYLKVGLVYTEDLQQRIVTIIPSQENLHPLLTQIQSTFMSRIQGSQKGREGELFPFDEGG